MSSLFTYKFRRNTSKNRLANFRKKWQYIGTIKKKGSNKDDKRTKSNTQTEN